MQFLKIFIAALLMSALLPVNDAVARDKRIEAYDAKGRRDPERDLVIRQGNAYRLDRQGRVLYEKGYIRLKDGEELDDQGRRTGRRYKLY
ncbi:hypothetical protein [Methylotuvimicrobium sp.]|uniref:hypothetical protein n=1 Tax=Methylotuvimicrobium sp. TaxID=2822413 RepID=UPI003D660755